MIYRQLLIITSENENYILVKPEHPSLYGEECSENLFFLFKTYLIVIKVVKKF